MILQSLIQSRRIIEKYAFAVYVFSWDIGFHVEMFDRTNERSAYNVARFTELIEKYTDITDMMGLLKRILNL